MERWEALLGIVNAAVLFLPVFVALFAADLSGTQRSAARDKRIAEYRKSPESHLLRLNY